VFPLALPGPASVAEIRRVIGPSKDIAVEGELPADEWEKNGATWWLRRLPSEGTISAFESVIDAGPPV
jgi:hypothetical protein